MVETKRSPLARIALSAGVVVLALAGLAPVALAGQGKPGGGGGSGSGGTTGGGSLSLVMVSDANSNGQPNWGDTVTFNVSTSASEPHVDLTCSKNGTVVYGATTGFYASYPWPWTRNMTLKSQSWTSGQASCTATLYYFSGTKTVTQAMLSFMAYA